MNFLLHLLFGPYFIWILLSLVIYIFRNQLLSLINRYNRRRSHLRFLREQTLNRYDAKARYELALNQLQWGNYQAAASLLQEAAAVDPENVDVHYYLGLTYLRLKNHPEAINEFQKCVSLKQDYSFGRAYLRLGDTYYAERDFPQALSFYQKVLEANPYEGEALYKTGLTNYRMGLKTEAKEYLNKAIAEIRALPRFRYKIDRIWFYKALWLKFLKNL